MSASSCPACGEPAAFPWRVAHQVVGGRAVGAGYGLQRCRACGTGSLSEPDQAPAPPELYETGAYTRPEGGWEPLLESTRRLLDRERLRLLGPLPAAARVIEVGAGRGRLIAVLRARGHDAVGIEPSRASCEVAAARGLPVEPLTLEEAEFPAGEANLVVLWHVLEHLDRPDVALIRIRPWLKPGGRLVVAVPNLGSLQARIGGDRWFHQDVPRHRTQFTMAGLSAVLARGGFAPTGVRHLFIEQNYLGMWLTALNWLTSDRDVPFRLVKRDLRYPSRGEALRDAVISVFAGIPLIPLACLLEAGAGFARRGGTVVAYASPV
jgi:SAM-dependent methyltransferase